MANDDLDSKIITGPCSKSSHSKDSDWNEYWDFRKFYHHSFRKIEDIENDYNNLKFLLFEAYAA